MTDLVSADALAMRPSILTGLHTAKQFLKGEVTITKSGAGYRQFLDEKAPPYIGTYGTACGILSLLACGENTLSQLVIDCCKWLTDTQLEDGCWITGSLGDVRLTTLTTYPLEALLRAGIPQQDTHVTLAIKWICDTQRKGDGGWGNFFNSQNNCDNQSRLIPTCHAVKALNITSFDGREQVLQMAYEWLQAKLPSLDQPGHLGLAALALLHGGPSEQLAAAQALERLAIAPLLWPTVLDTFYVYPVGSEKVTHVNYHVFSLGIGLQALCAGLGNPLDLKTVSVAKELLNQQREGYWIEPSMPGKIPIWSICDATQGLRQFLGLIDTNKLLLQLNPRLEAAEEELRRLRADVTDVVQTVTELRTRKHWVATIRPFLRRNAPYVAIGMALAAYIGISIGFKLPWEANLAAGLLAASMTAIRVWVTLRGSK